MKQPFHSACVSSSRPAGFALDEGYDVAYAYDMFGGCHSFSSSASSATSAVTFTYSYLSDTDLISGMTAFSGFLWTRAYESGRSLITSVANRFGEMVISRYDYTNDALGRRTSRADSGLAFATQPTYGDSDTVEMPAYNAYSYNTRSEVTGAARRWGTNGASGELFIGQQYAYEFDGIGNRITAAEGDTSRSAIYTANALNQYTQRTVPDEKDLIGTAPTNVAVTVNQNPVSRQNAYWHHPLEVDNATDAAYPQVAITAVYNPPGTNDPDVVTSVTGRVFVAKTPEQFTYDDDGNLTQDGRFTYTWNGENRLIKVETRDDLPASVPRVKVEYAYDHQGRRIAFGTSIWTNDTWQAAESRSFLYDGWNVVAEQVGRTVPGEPSIVATNLYTWGLDLSGSRQGAGGIGGLLAASLNDSTALYCFDANGNVGQLVSTEGDLLAHYEYSPFGETVVSTGPLAKANPFRFSTKHWDDLTGLGYWGYRWYSPGMGRWLSRDPIGEKGGLSQCCYVYNSPFSWVDPEGYAPILANTIGEQDTAAHIESFSSIGIATNVVDPETLKKILKCTKKFSGDVPGTTLTCVIDCVKHSGDNIQMAICMAKCVSKGASPFIVCCVAHPPNDDGKYTDPLDVCKLNYCRCNLNLVFAWDLTLPAKKVKCDYQYACCIERAKDVPGMW